MKSLLKKYTQRAGYVFGIAVAAIVVGVSLQFAKAWTEPSQTAPSGNVGAPINTGSANQTKQGDLFYGLSGMRTGSRDNAGLQGNAGATSGFFETAAPSNFPTGASSWWHLLDARHSNVSNNYAMQIAGSFFDQDLYFRKTNNNPSAAWNKFVYANSAGNVGIGTTSPTSLIGVNRFLEISGSSHAGIVMTDTDAGAGKWDIWNDNGGLYSYRSGGTGYLGYGWAISPAGNVGIGSTNPGSKLTVIGSSGLINGGGYVQHVGGTDGNTDPYRYMIGFSHGDSGGSSGNVRAGVGMMVSPGGLGNLIFETGGSGTQAERMRINGGGNVGIGTTVPGAKLDVGIGSSQCCAAQTPNISLAQASNTNGNMSWLQFHNAGESEAYIRLAGGGAGIRAGQRRLEIGDSQGVTTGLTVTGNVGIGTTTPARKLDVVGGDIIVNGVGIGKGGNNIADNTAVGASALASNTTGYQNTANGYTALSSNTSGVVNTANGAYALALNTTGYRNTANGYAALYVNTTGFSNTANGAAALQLNTIGAANTANGYSALYSNTTGMGNTANGYAAHYLNTTGSYNTSIGYSTLYNNTTGSYNTAIGYNAGVSISNLTNATAIGYNSVVSASNALVLGNNVNVGIGISAPVYKLDVVGDVHGTGNGYFDSDIKLKYDISSIGSQAIENLKKINGVRFNWKKDGSASMGVIAQDVEKVYPELVRESSGVKSVNYDGLAAPLVEAVKAQQVQIEELKIQIEELKNK